MQASVRSGFDTHNRDEAKALVAAIYAENRLRADGSVGEFRMTESPMC